MAHGPLVRVCGALLASILVDPGTTMIRGHAQRIPAPRNTDHLHISSPRLLKPTPRPADRAFPPSRGRLTRPPAPRRTRTGAAVLTRPAPGGDGLASPLLAHQPQNPTYNTMGGDETLRPPAPPASLVSRPQQPPPPCLSHPPPPPFLLPRPCRCRVTGGERGRPYVRGDGRTDGEERSITN